MSFHNEEDEDEEEDEEEVDFAAEEYDFAV